MTVGTKTGHQFVALDQEWRGHRGAVRSKGEGSRSLSGVGTNYEFLDRARFGVSDTWGSHHLVAYESLCRAEKQPKMQLSLSLSKPASCVAIVAL